VVVEGPLPHWTDASEAPVYRPRASRLEAVRKSTKGIGLTKLQQHVHVIRHDDPCDEFGRSQELWRIQGPNNATGGVEIIE
jgi:hypothetical protein